MGTKEEPREMVLLFCDRSTENVRRGGLLKNHQAKSEATFNQGVAMSEEHMPRRVSVCEHEFRRRLRAWREEKCHGKYARRGQGHES